MQRKLFHSLTSEIKVDRRILRQFAWLMTVMLGLIVPLIITWINGWQLVQAAWIVSAIGVLFLMAGLLVPAWLRPVYIAWMLLALLLGTVVTRIIITIVFYLMITPIGWTRRTFGTGDPLGLQPEPDNKSYWMNRKEGPNPGQMKKQF
jgi:hypothetical protein